jgi:nucleoside-diphosphate-sugar epimerase
VTETVLVTGAAGGVGRALVPALRDHGWSVRALAHRRAVPEADEQVDGDLLDGRGLDEATRGVAAAVHLAARTHARRGADYESLNVGGTRRLLEALARAGARRLVHVSTRAIDPQGGDYSRSKAAAEEAVRASGLDFTIVRLPEVYGAGSREGVDAVLARVRAGRPVPLVGAGSDEVCPIPLADAVAAIAAALENPDAVGRTYTLAGECVTLRRFVELAAAAAGSRSRIVGVPAAAVGLASVAARVLPLPIFPDQLARLRAPKPPATPAAAGDLGFRPPPLEQGLRGLRGA